MTFSTLLEFRQLRKGKEKKSFSSSHEKSESFVGSNSFRERSPKNPDMGRKVFLGVRFVMVPSTHCPEIDRSRNVTTVLKLTIPSSKYLEFFKDFGTAYILNVEMKKKEYLGNHI